LLANRTCLARFRPEDDTLVNVPLVRYPALSLARRLMQNRFARTA
jgi:hypothetical protein